MGLFPNARFVIVGGELPGSHHQAYAAHLKQLRHALGLDMNVIFTGFRPDVPNAMAAADVVVHCSKFPDPFPGVVLQGMACGKPVIATDIGGTGEQIEHGVSGLLIHPDDPGELAEWICRLLQDPDYRKELGQAAAHRVSTEFSVGVFRQKLSQVYLDVACKQGKTVAAKEFNV